MAKTKHPAKTKGRGLFRRVPQVLPTLPQRPGQRLQATLVPRTPSSVGIAASPNRAVYRHQIRQHYPLPTPRNRQAFAPFSPPPGLRGK